MKLYISIILFLNILNSCFAQTPSLYFIKPSIDTSIFNKWPSIGIWPIISNDGNYVLYSIRNQPVGKTSLIIQGTKCEWKYAIPDVSSGKITQDSKLAIFLKAKDSLSLLSLGTSSIEYIRFVNSFQLFQQGGDEWLVYHLKNNSKELICRNLRTGIQQNYFSVNRYFLSDNCSKLLLEREVYNGKVFMEMINFRDSSCNILWEGANASGFIFDSSGSQIAFVVDSIHSGKIEKSLWYYNDRLKKTVLLVNNDKCAIEGLKIDRIAFPGFSKDGSRLYFVLKEESKDHKKNDVVNIDIWSYSDVKLQSQQLKELDSKSYFAVINLANHAIFRLQNENETMNLFGNKPFESVTYSKGDFYEHHWNNASKPSYYLINVSNNERKKIKMRILRISPMSKYVICQDLLNRDLYSYNISLDKYTNITKSLPIPLEDVENDEPGDKSRGLSFAAWLNNDDGLLIYDRYDLWLLDLNSNKVPINITNGYGRKHNIIFRLAENYANVFVKEKDKFLLSAFDRISKNNGFYKTSISQKGNPEFLSMGPYLYHMPEVNGLRSFFPIKAKDTSVFLVRRESAQESPNYFITTDFRKFTQLSFVQPEKNFNWVKAELITWKTFNGITSQGILYKPENINLKRKYPVIIHYYEKKSDRLNKYEAPDYINDNINISFLVSNGYLVFTPDIYYEIGNPGKSTVNSIVSAVEYLGKNSWVDKNKIGLQGHSFGGYETNYLITQTNIFAAAMSASGISDLISASGSVMSSTGIPHSRYATEVGQVRIGSTLWQRPELYILNSPIFYANKITTPLLMMNNKEDGAVPFAQGVEFFTALRRLGKKVWMLQYDGEPHSLHKYNAMKDFTNRILQFFDHYLRDKPAPKWITQGISAAMKGIETGYDLDPAGNCGLEGNKCKVCCKWNEMYRKTPQMFSKSFNEWSSGME